MTRTAQGTTSYPATMWQKYVLDEANHPNCPDDLRDRMILANAYLIRPGVDVRRLKRAIKRVRQRHDTLRIRFHHVKGDWQAQIDHQDADILRIVDLGDVDDATFRATTTKLAHAPMSLVDSSLVEIFIVRCGARGDALITRVHHVLTDAFGMILLAEELAKLMIGLPVTGRTVSHADYLATYQDPSPAQRAQCDAFWSALHHDFPKAPKVGRKAKGLAPLLNSLGDVDQRRMVFPIDAERLLRLENIGKSANCSTTTVLFAGYLESLCQCYDLDRLMFLTTVARTEPALFAFGGNHTHKPVIPYQSMGKGKLTAAAKSLAQTLADVIAHLPSDAGRHNSAYRTAMIEAGAYPTQFSVLQPSPGHRQNQSFLSGFLYGDYAGEQQFGPLQLSPIDVSVPHRIFSDMELNVGAARQRDNFTIHYDGISYSDEEIEAVGAGICELLTVEST